MTGAARAVARHLEAITGRDLVAYAASLHEDVALVLPGGTRLLGRAEVERFHREFFANPRWTQHLTEIRTTITEHTATALYEVGFSDVDLAGSPIDKRFLVTFVFIRCGSDWLLLHDQCTPLPDQHA